MAQAKRKGGGMGSGDVGARPVGTTDPAIPDEHDFSDEIMGKNRLQGDDQGSVRNQRLTQPGALDQGKQPRE